MRCNTQSRGSMGNRQNVTCMNMSSAQTSSSIRLLLLRKRFGKRSIANQTQTKAPTCMSSSLKPCRYPATKSCQQFRGNPRFQDCRHLQAGKGTNVQVVALKTNSHVGYAAHLAYRLNRIFSLIVNKRATKAEPHGAHIKHSLRLLGG